MKSLLISSVIRTFVRIASWLPLKFLHALATILGAVFWRFPNEMARITAINIKLCFPELNANAQSQLGKESLQETFKIGLEYGVIWYWSESRWLTLITEVRGWDRVEKALAGGRGVLLLVPHIGNWEMLNVFLCQHTRFIALFDPPKQSSVAAGLFTARNRLGTELQPIGMAGLRNIYKALANQRVVIVLPDQVPDRRAGVYAPFFRQPALTMSFGLRVLHKSDAAVFCAVVERVDDGFEISFEDFPEGIRDDDLAVQAAAMNRGIEAAIRKTPAQYQWEYKRFKRPPEGTSDSYKRK